MSFVYAFPTTKKPTRSNPTSYSQLRWYHACFHGSQRWCKHCAAVADALLLPNRVVFYHTKYWAMSNTNNDTLAPTVVVVCYCPWCNSRGMAFLTSHAKHTDWCQWCCPPKVLKLDSCAAVCSRPAHKSWAVKHMKRNSLHTWDAIIDLWDCRLDF